ncbi:MAG: amino acid permease, partial [Bacteroidota bacterium]
MDTQNKKSTIETELSRDLGLTSTLAIGVGTMIAAGIFTLSGLAIRNVGSAAILSFLLAAVVALFTALTYCEFVSIYPRTGEGYLYARKTYPAPLAYFVGWALFLGYASSCAFYIASLSSYFNEFIYHSPVEALFGIVTLIGLIFLNIKGTKESGRFQIVVTAAKVLLLIWFIWGGLSFVNMEEVMAKFSNDIVMI